MTVEALPKTVAEKTGTTTVISVGEQIRRFLQDKTPEFTENQAAWQVYEPLVRAKAQKLYEETGRQDAIRNWYEAEKELALVLDSEIVRQAKAWKRFQDELTALARRFKEDEIQIMWALYKMLGWGIDLDSGRAIY